MRGKSRKAGARQIACGALCLAVTLGLAGCRNDGDAGAAGRPFTVGGADESSASSVAPEIREDAFAYCDAVGTVNAPDQRLAGAGLPPEVARALRHALDLPAEVSDQTLSAGSHWRCMDGKVYGCFVGANLPCLEQADTSQEPTIEMRGYCAENPESAAIPAVVTGRATIYSWRCSDGAPEVAEQVAQVDPAGYLEHIWYELAPGRGG
jgi:hypothetical protein